MLQTEPIQTLASYYTAAENPSTFFIGWTRENFMQWMCMGRHNKGYQEALENLWLRMTDNYDKDGKERFNVDRFADLVQEELQRINEKKKNGQDKLDL